jgi:hypothetical protein
MKDLVGKIMAWEEGRMSPKETVRFFGELVKSGMVWKLQGVYGRTAVRLIEQGYITNTGKVNKKKLESLV